MAKTKTLTLRNVRASELDMQDALRLLRKKLPKAKVAKLEVNNEDQYVAHIIIAEFPPSKDKGEDSGPSFEESDSEPDSDSDDSGGEEAPALPELGGGEEKPEGKKKGEGGKIDKILSQIELIVNSLGLSDEMGMGDEVGPAMPDLPDVGAPSKGPMPPAPMDKPLPPPAQKPNPGMGNAFAAKRTVTAWREDDGTSVKDVLKEAESFFPGHRVAKIERHMGKGANGYEGPVLLVALVRS